MPFCFLDYCAVSDDRLQLFAERVLQFGFVGFGDVDVEPAGGDHLLCFIENGVSDDNNFAFLPAGRANGVSAAEWSS
jgi:hypothetical protein